MPSLSRGHLRIVLFASLVFRNSLKRNAFPLGEQRSGGASFGGNLRQSSEASQSVIHGGAPPAPMSPSDVADVVLLVGIQAVLFTSVIVAFMLSLR